MITQILVVKCLIAGSLNCEVQIINNLKRLIVHSLNVLNKNQSLNQFRNMLSITKPCTINYEHLAVSY